MPYSDYLSLVNINDSMLLMVITYHILQFSNAELIKF